MGSPSGGDVEVGKRHLFAIIHSFSMNGIEFSGVSMALDCAQGHGHFSGNSEIRNWIAAAGAAEHLTMKLVDYAPCYRSPEDGIRVARVRGAE